MGTSYLNHDQVPDIVTMRTSYLNHHQVPDNGDIIFKP